jgi:N4-(beta-N-acetylglucosaminyl)-L-asparaginase
MNNRRSFIKKAGGGLAALALAPVAGCLNVEEGKNENNTAIVPQSGGFPLILSTWNHGIPANDQAWKTLKEGGSILDAVEAGVKVIEADPENTSVGIGGFPDRDGIVTLDACIMDEKGNAGSVCFLQNIMHPISVARKVMEDTPHVMLAGAGALKFAIEKGFEEVDLLTENARKAWEEWLKTSQYKPIANIENHDTIGLIGMDEKGNMAGACTTSGMAFKLHGRVGDSPIIGAGLYVDNEVGAATATGVGELVIKTCGSFLVVELMRQGLNPQQACEEAVNRIAAKMNTDDLQVGYIAFNKKGETGAYSIHPGFNYAKYQSEENKMFDAGSLRKP